jgi:hypothetical protein
MNLKEDDPVFAIINATEVSLEKETAPSRQCAVKPSRIQPTDPSLAAGSCCNHSVLHLQRGSGDRLLSSTARSRGRAIASYQSEAEFKRMKIKQIITLIVGITAVAVSPITWAAGHGGGGGFGGGHIGGGGFQAGGFHGGGQVAGGVGSRGGGVGFGRARFSGDLANFAGAGSRFSSFGRPSSRQPVYDGRPNRAVTHSVGGITAPNRQQNHFASGTQASRPEGARQLNQRFPGLRNHVVARHEANWHNDWDRRRAHFDHGRFFVFVDGFWCGLDDGFFPWDYLPYYPDDYYPYDYNTNLDPYDYNGTTYNPGSADAGTVQAVQTQLFNLGYYSGSIDGVFGPTTRDAVAKYQIANHLNVTGSLSPDTLTSLGLPQATPS